MFAVEHVTDEKGDILVQDPPIAQFLFSNTRAAWIWLISPGISAAGVGLLPTYAETMLAVRSMKFLGGASVMIGPSGRRGSGSIAAAEYVRERPNYL